jgi:hypothetical protein
MWSPAVPSNPGSGGRRVTLYTNQGTCTYSIGSARYLSLPCSEAFVHAHPCRVRIQASKLASGSSVLPPPFPVSGQLVGLYLFLNRNHACTTTLTQRLFWSIPYPKFDKYPHRSDPHLPLGLQRIRSPAIAWPGAADWVLGCPTSGLEH